MNYQILTPNHGWSMLAAESFARPGPGGRRARALDINLFVGQVPEHLLNADASALNALARDCAPVGQVESNYGMSDVAPYFDWVPVALSLAELEDLEPTADQDLLWCQGAAYHDDVAFNQIFCVAHLHGARGDLVFPRAKARVPMSPGIFVIFDCREPHGFLRPNAQQFIEAEYPSEARTFFAAQNLDPYGPELERFFSENNRRKVPSWRYRVDPTTGAYVDC